MTPVGRGPGPRLGPSPAHGIGRGAAGVMNHAAGQENMTHHQEMTGPILALTQGQSSAEDQEEEEEQEEEHEVASNTTSSEEERLVSPQHRQRIIVPDRTIQGGLDWKFETDSDAVKLHGIMTREDYTDSIVQINEGIRPARAGKADAVLLATGPLLVPLAVWGMRHGRQVKLRKRLLKQAIAQFNATHSDLWMRWDRSLPESRLTIERRPQDTSESLPQQPAPEFVSEVVVQDDKALV